MTTLVRFVYGSVVGSCLIIAALVVGKMEVAVGLAAVGPVATFPWVFMPMLERALMWLQERRS